MTKDTRLRVALAALAAMVNDYGHTSLCWHDLAVAKKAGVRVDGCMSEACSLARRALGIERLRDPRQIRIRLDRLQAAIPREEERTPS